MSLAADETTRDQCYDAKVYWHYISTGKHAGTEQEAKRRALHDHAIRQALNRFLKGRDGGHSPWRVARRTHAKRNGRCNRDAVRFSLIQRCRVALYRIPGYGEISPRAIREPQHPHLALRPRALGRKFWTEDVPVYPFLKSLQAKGRYKNLPLSIHDDSEEIVKELLAFGNS